jgi:hypothetical protein
MVDQAVSLERVCTIPVTANLPWQMVLMFADVMGVLDKADTHSSDHADVLRLNVLDSVRTWTARLVEW